MRLGRARVLRALLAGWALLAPAVAWSDQLTLVSEWGADVNDPGGVKGDNDGADGVSWSGANIYRTANRFPTTGVSGTITQIQLRLNVTSVLAMTSENVYVDSYGTDGSANPETDSATTMFAGCNASGGAQFTDLRTTGLKTFDITSAQLLADLDARVDASNADWGVAVRLVSETGSSHEAIFDEYTDGTAGERPAIIVTFTPPGTDPAGCCTDPTRSVVDPAFSLQDPTRSVVDPAKP